MSNYINIIESYMVYPFEKVRRKIPMREKHLYTFIFTVIALIASEIPLVGGIRTDYSSEVTFKVSGTLMQLGTQPFVFASMATPFIFEKEEKQNSNVLGLLLSFFMALQWAWNNSSWFGGLELCFIGWALLQAEVYLKDRGSISPTTALIFANASRKVLLSIFLQPISFIWMAILIVVVAWIETLNVSIPLTHMKYRHQSTGMELPVMYNSTTALIMYYTVIETIATWYPPSRFLMSNRIEKSVFLAAPMLYIGVYAINKQLSTLNKQNGKDLVQKWKEQKYTIKGWRDPKKMYKYVQNIIDRNIYWNTIFICALWTLSVIYPPSVGITTLFILIGTVKRHRPSWKLF